MATGIGESLALAKVSNFDPQSSETENNPPEHGVIEYAKMRMAEIAPVREET